MKVKNMRIPILGSVIQQIRKGRNLGLATDLNFNHHEPYSEPDLISVVDDTGFKDIDVLIRLKRLETVLMDAPIEIGQFREFPSTTDTVYVATSTFLDGYNQKLRGPRSDGVGQYVLFPALFGGHKLWEPQLPPITYTLRISWEKGTMTLSVDSLLPRSEYRKLPERDLVRVGEDLEVLRESNLRLDAVLQSYARKNALLYLSPFSYNGQT